MTSTARLSQAAPPRNLIVCSDGTGNAGGKGRGTNIWRIYNAIERRGANVGPEQIAFYDDGVGTEDFKFLKVLGGAFGWGFTRNLIDAYSFLSLNYDAARGDKIYLFGFSRGAFTVRSFAGIIIKCGLLSREHFQDATEPRKLVKSIIKAYRKIDAIEPGADPEASSEAKQEASGDLDALKEQHPKLKDPVPIRFIGVFDTVDAVGVPSDKLRKRIGPLWRKLFRRRLYDFSDRDLSTQVEFGAQALSIDDERKTFHPNLWSESRGDDVQQVWFAGAHSNVGGGYPRDAVSLVPLEWMIEQAEENGLRFVPDALDGLRASAGQIGLLDQPIRAEQNAITRGLATADPHGQLYNPRKGIGIIYNYAPRELPKHAAKIHASVYDRILRGTTRYAPRVIPYGAEVAVSKQGPWAKAPAVKPALREADLERIRNLAKMRASTYRIFVGVLLVVAAVVSALCIGQAFGKFTIPVATGLFWDVVRWPIPRITEPVVNLVATFPRVSLALIATFGLLLTTSSILRSAIGKTSFEAWQRAIGEVIPERALAQEESESAGFEKRAEDFLSKTRGRVLGLRIATLAAAAAALALAAVGGPGFVKPDPELPTVVAGPPSDLSIPVTESSRGALE